MSSVKTRRPARPKRNPKLPKAIRERAVYQTDLGLSLLGKSEEVLPELLDSGYRGSVQLVFTSPPFPLNRKKKYDNLQGSAFKKWLAGYASVLKELLTPDGAIVLEMGNAWVRGKPVMSTLAIESLLAFKKAAGLHLLQEFVWHNPAKLPTPAQWVTIERIRVKDSFTKIWWMSPNPRAKANNRNVKKPYSQSMQDLLRTRKYNAGRRPSEHVISEESFFTDNGGAIPPNVLSVKHDEEPESVLVGSNTHSSPEYMNYCKHHNIVPHPARMPRELAEFFIRLCTDPNDLVLDPFAGSNTTGATAEELKRRWIAIEASGEYAESGRSRFESALVKK